MTKLQLPNLHQTVNNTYFSIKISNSNNVNNGIQKFYHLFHTFNKNSWDGEKTHMYETWKIFSFQCPDLILYLLRPAIHRNFLSIKPRFNILTSSKHYQQNSDQTSAFKSAPNCRQYQHVSQHQDQQFYHLFHIFNKTHWMATKRRCMKLKNDFHFIVLIWFYICCVSTTFELASSNVKVKSIKSTKQLVRFPRPTPRRLLKSGEEPVY